MSRRRKGRGPGRITFRSGETEDARRGATGADNLYRDAALWSLATLDEAEIEKNLPQWTQTVLESNRMKAAAGEDRVCRRGAGPDQARDLHHQGEPDLRSDSRRSEKDGKPVGNGDPSLTMYGEAVTPNEHKLALQFGVLDNFFDSGEVSGDGHVWSNGGDRSDYLEKTWQQTYRGGAAHLRLRGRGRRRVSAAAEDSRRERAGQRLSVGRSGRAWQDVLPLRRVHLDDILQ